MKRLLLAVVLVAGCATWRTTGRLVDGPCDHLGIRPQSDDVRDVGVTLQWSTERGAALGPGCPARADAS